MRILVAIMMLILFYGISPAAEVTECTSETTGLKYTELEGSGIASLFFFPFLAAMAPVAMATDDTGQYKCHIAVIGRDSLTVHKPLKKKIKGLYQ